MGPLNLCNLINPKITINLEVNKVSIVLLKISFRVPCLQGPQAWFNILPLNHLVAILKFLTFFEQKALYFHFAQGSNCQVTKLAGFALILHEKQLSIVFDLHQQNIIFLSLGKNFFYFDIHNISIFHKFLFLNTLVLGHLGHSTEIC